MFRDRLSVRCRTARRIATKCLALAAFLFQATESLAASDREATSVSLEDAIAIALREHYEMRSARLAVEQAQGRARHAARIENPELEVSASGDEWVGGVGESSWSVGVYQPLAPPRRRSIDKKIGRLDVERAQEELRDAARRLIERVQGCYIRVLASRQAADLRRLSADEHRKLRDSLADRVRLGQASAVDLALAESSAALAWNRMRDAEGVAEADEIELKTLLGRPANQPILLRDALDSLIDRLGSFLERPSAVPNRPDLRAIRREVLIADWEAQRVRAEAWDGVRVGIEYARDRANDFPEGLSETDFVGAKVVVPLPMWNRNQGAASERIAVRNALRVRLEGLERALENEIQAALREVSRGRERVQDLRTQGVDTLRARAVELRRGFEEGRADLRDWLAVQSSLVELEVEHVSAQASLAHACTRWIALTGSDPALQALGLPDDPTHSPMDEP